MQNENPLDLLPEDQEIPEEDVLWDSDQAASPEDEVPRSQEQPIETEGEAELPLEDSPVPTLPESKSRRFFRHLIRWTAGTLIVFGLGLLTAIFLLYRPAVQNAETDRQTMQAEMDQAHEQIADLENQVASLLDRIAALESLEEANAQLLDAQGSLNLHIAILDARLDITSALLALSEQDSAHALVILDQTAATLDQIGQFLTPEQLNTITNMKQRLELTLTEIENDPYAAKSDLDVLATNLLQLQDALISD